MKYHHKYFHYYCLLPRLYFSFSFVLQEKYSWNLEFIYISSKTQALIKWTFDNSSHHGIIAYALILVPVIETLQSVRENCSYRIARTKWNLELNDPSYRLVVNYIKNLRKKKIEIIFCTKILKKKIIELVCICVRVVII